MRSEDRLYTLAVKGYMLYFIGEDIPKNIYEQIDTIAAHLDTSDVPYDRDASEGLESVGERFAEKVKNDFRYVLKRVKISHVFRTF